MLLTAAGGAGAQGVAYEFDKGHANISFAVNHLGYSTVSGRFLEFEGRLSLDRADPKNSSVAVTIHTHSIDTGLQARDRHLRGDDFFSVVKHPTMTFSSTNVKPIGRDMTRAEVTGVLTLLGVAKPITLAVTLNKLDPHPRSGKVTAGFDATGTIKRSDFGMTFGLPGVGDDIKIAISIEAAEAAVKAQP